MYENNETVFKVKADKEGLTIKISIEDLLFLFENSPTNYTGDGPDAKVIKGKEEAFCKRIVELLLDFPDSDAENIRLGKPFEFAFEEICCSGEDFIMDTQIVGEEK